MGRSFSLRHIHEWVMSHAWISHVIPMSVSWLTYQWVMSHISMSFVSHINELCLARGWCTTYEWVKNGLKPLAKAYAWMSHVAHICVMSHRMCYIYTCDCIMAHVWMNRVSPTNRLKLFAQAYKWMRHFANVNATCHTQECGIAHLWMSHVSYMSQTWIMSCIWMCHASRMSESCLTCEWAKMSRSGMVHVTYEGVM